MTWLLSSMALAIAVQTAGKPADDEDDKKKTEVVYTFMISGFG